LPDESGKIAFKLLENAFLIHCAISYWNQGVAEAPATKWRKASELWKNQRWTKREEN